MDSVANPALIQAGPSNSSTMPLFFIHDESGIVLNYFLLGSLGRAVYGISNPYFKSGKAWVGGMADIAKSYVGLIRSVYPRGKFLLGGYSLGGLISLEVALAFANQEASPLSVQGIIMIDTIFPSARVQSQQQLTQQLHWYLRGDFSPEFRACVKSCVAQSEAMVEAWSPPTWPIKYIYETPSDSDSTSSVSSQTVQRAEAIRYRQPPPPAVLLRNKQCISVVKGEEDILYDEEASRKQRMLGWENYKEEFIFSVVDIDGHYFSVLDDEYVSVKSTILPIALLKRHKLYSKYTRLYL